MRKKRVFIYAYGAERKSQPRLQWVFSVVKRKDQEKERATLIAHRKKKREGLENMLTDR